MDEPELMGPDGGDGSPRRAVSSDCCQRLLKVSTVGGFEISLHGALGLYYPETPGDERAEFKSVLAVSCLRSSQGDPVPVLYSRQRLV
jgi:hypothetical protein